MDSPLRAAFVLDDRASPNNLPNGICRHALLSEVGGDLLRAGGRADERYANATVINSGMQPG